METHQPGVRPGRTPVQVGLGVVRGRRCARPGTRAERTELPRRAGARRSAMACVTGFAVAVAGSGWWNVPLQHILWLGVVWTGVICIVDRLIYKSFGTSRVTNLVLAVPRAALSVMLALVLGLPMVQFIFQPSISKQLTQTSALEQKSARQAATRLLRAQDQTSSRGDRVDPDRRDDAREPGPEVHPPLRLREQRAVVLAHPPLRLRALVPLLRRPGKHRSRRAHA